MNRLQLRPEQQRVVDEYRGGFAAISAVPGAGKTTTLSVLATHLIEHRLLLRQRVIIVTYQNAAVANFQSAIRQRLEERGLKDRGYVIRTLHGLALEVLQLAGRRIDLDIEARVIDELEADALLYSIIEDQILRHHDNLRDMVVYPDLPAARRWPDRRVLYAIIRDCLREVKQRAVDLEELYLRIPPGDRWMPFVLDTIRTYNTELAQLGKIDFDDMILRAVVALEENDLLAHRLRGRWPYLLEDEAQDSTPLQEQMLLHIAGNNGNLMRVGDANQAILSSFTSSDVRGFRRWLGREDVQHFELQGSSRSTAAVVNLANRFMEQVREEFPVESARSEALDDLAINMVDGQNPALPGDGLRSGLTVKVFENTDNERREVLQRAIGHLQRNPRDRVAILTGSRELGYQYCTDAVDFGFPDDRLIRLLGGNDGRPVSLIDRLMPLIEFLENPVTGHKLARALQNWSPLGQNDRVARFVNQLGPSSSPTLAEFLYPTDGDEMRSGVQGQLADEEWMTLRRLRSAPVWLANRLEPPDRLLSLLAVTLELDDETRSIFNRIVATARQLDPNPQLDRLTQLRLFLIDLRNRKRRLRGTPEEFAIRIDPGTLSVSTRHQAKGLEWDIVFAIGCDDFWFPGSLDIARLNQRDYLGPDDPVIEARTELTFLLDGNPSAPSSPDIHDAIDRDARDQVAERLRVMYVTITRARRGLWVSWHKTGYLGERQMPRQESILIDMLGKIIAEVDRDIGR